MKYKFYTSPNFQKEFKALFKKYKSLKTDLQKLQEEFINNPELGTSLGDGLRKIRLNITAKSSGKSGGARVISHELLIEVGIQKQWEKAVKVYEQATKAYESCGDYLMQCETLRLSAWVKEHNNQKSDAIDDYTKAFYLINKMIPEIAKHSTYPLIVQKLLDSTIRLDKLSDKEMDNVLSPILGEEWRSYVKEYRKN